MSSSQYPAAAATSVPVSTSVSSRVYAAQPAFPVLASALLSRYCRQGHHHRENDQDDRDHETVSTTAKATNDKKSPPPTTAAAAAAAEWNLMTDFEKGVRTQTREDDSCIFRCGATIGFSWLKKKKEDQSRERERAGELPRRLLASLLLRTRKESNNNNNDSRSQPKAFIIHPTNSSTFAPETLLQDVMTLDGRHHQHKPASAASLLSRSEAITLLDTVHLLAVYDFPSAVQAISQVSDALHNLHIQRKQHEQSSSGKDEPILLIIEGLDSLAEGIIRTSNPLRGSALLMPALRTLTHLSRTYSSFLAVLVVNTLGLGAHSNRTTSSGDTNTVNPEDGGLHSIFFRSASTTSAASSGSGSRGGSLLPTLLSRTLDQGIDIHLLLSSVKGKAVVEVIKDRMGGGVGRWCVWE